MTSFSPPAGTLLVRRRKQRFEATVQYNVASDMRFGQIDLCREPGLGPRSDCVVFQTREVHTGVGTATLSGEVEVPDDRASVTVHIRLFVQPRLAERRRVHDLPLIWPTRPGEGDRDNVPR